MGLFDKIICKYPLPSPGALVNLLTFQTKDTDFPNMDKYEIREDGTFWHENYDIEDRSDPNAKGIWALCGCMTRINRRWEQVKMTGEIRFYTTYGENDSGWLEFSSYFVDGKLNQLHLLKHQEAK
jgi:hypothetical protein